jgi:hypothetical protein
MMIAEQVKIGEGATFGYGSDRNPYTVIAVSTSGKQITIQADEVMVTRGSYIEEQDCVFLPDTEGSTIVARWNESRQRWMVGGKRGTVVSVGVRRYYRDPHF